MWVLCDRQPVKQWGVGRLTLVGDAAHPMLQYLAQGACMAIEDAVCIADAVSEADGDLAAAFRRYETDRYLRTARVQITARIYGEVFHAAGVARELRNAMLSRRPQAAAMESMLERSLSRLLIYRSSISLPVRCIQGMRSPKSRVDSNVYWKELLHIALILAGLMPHGDSPDGLFTETVESEWPHRRCHSTP